MLSPKYSYFIFKDNIVDNFSDRFLCTGMTENTNVGLFTLPFKVPHKWLLQNAPNKITHAFPPPPHPMILLFDVENFCPSLSVVVASNSPHGITAFRNMPRKLYSNLTKYR